MSINSEFDPENPVLPTNYTNLPAFMRRVVRELYVAEQKGLCAHCKAPLSEKAAPEVESKWIYKRLFPENFFQYPVHLHHDHDTEMTVGAVHAKCNAVLWQYHGK